MIFSNALCLDNTVYKYQTLFGKRKIRLKAYSRSESPLNVMKNAFYLTLKALFVLRYLNFALTFWSCRKQLD